MDKGKIIFDVLNDYVYNDTNQAGDELHIIDASDLSEIIPKIVENLGLPSVSNCPSCDGKNLLQYRQHHINCTDCKELFTMDCD